MLKRIRMKLKTMLQYPPRKLDKEYLDHLKNNDGCEALVDRMRMRIRRRELMDQLGIRALIAKGIKSSYADTKSYRKTYMSSKEGQIFEGDRGYIKIKPVAISKLPNMPATK